MTNIQEYSKPYFRLLSDNDAAADEISSQIVLFLRDLYLAYPDPLTEQESALVIVDQVLRRQIIGWLAAEHFIKAESENVWLSFTGSETVRKTCRDKSVYQSFFLDRAVPPPAQATELVLALLRTHFDGGRAGLR